MSIKDLQQIQVGVAGVKPSILLILTDDTEAVVLGTGYLTEYGKSFGFNFSNFQSALVYTTDTNSNWYAIDVGLDGTASLINPTNIIIGPVDFVTNTDWTAQFPDSQPLSALPSGFITVTTGTGILDSTLLAGTANQIDITNTDGSATPAFSLSSTLIVPGTLKMLNGNAILSDTSLLVTATTSADFNTPWVSVTGLRKYGESTNKIQFGTNQQQFLPDNTLRMQLSSSGMQLGTGGANVTNISNSPTTVLATDLMTAEAIQSLVATSISGGQTLIGGYDASSDLFPATGGSGPGGDIELGNWWYITVAGTLGGTPVDVGDQIFALVDVPGQTAGNWLVALVKVNSVFGRIGVVTAQSGDYDFTEISGTAAADQGGTGITDPDAAGNVLTSDGAGAWISAPVPADAVTSVFGRTGVVIAATNDYNFNQLAGTAAVGQGGTGLTSPGTSGNVLTSNGSAWVSAAVPSAAVSSVFGRTGAVVAESGDYAFSEISGTAASSQGGTGFTTYAAGDLIHASGINVLDKLAIGDEGDVLTVVSGDVAWAPGGGPGAVTSVFSRTGDVVAESGDYDFTEISGTAVETQGGTNQTTYTKGDLLHASADDTLGKLAIGSIGDVLTVNGAGDDVEWAAPGGGGGLTFNTVTGSTQAMATDNIYYSTYAGTCVMTLPASAAAGKEIEVMTDASHVIQIAQNSGQLIYYAAQNGVSQVTTTGTGGSLITTDPNTTLKLRCIVTDTTWSVVYANNSVTGA